jgi:hypothetical protein
MYNTDPVILVARKTHCCTWCSEPIEAGDSYRRWVTFDDCAFVSKMHPECVGACDEECREWGGEYIAFDNERPKPDDSPDAGSAVTATAVPDEKERN